MRGRKGKGANTAEVQPCSERGKERGREEVRKARPCVVVIADIPASRWRVKESQNRKAKDFGARKARRGKC